MTVARPTDERGSDCTGENSSWRQPQTGKDPHEDNNTPDPVGNSSQQVMCCHEVVVMHDSAHPEGKGPWPCRQFIMTVTTAGGPSRLCTRSRAAAVLLQFRSATAGSIRVARQAGAGVDAAAVIATRIVTTANVTKSSGYAPNTSSRWTG